MSPTRPSSSPIEVKMKSVLESGTRSGRPAPRPVPSMPPVASPKSPWATWKLVLAGSPSGWSHTSTRSCTRETNVHAAKAPPPKMTRPMSTQEDRSVAT